MFYSVLTLYNKVALCDPNMSSFFPPNIYFSASFVLIPHCVSVTCLLYMVILFTDIYMRLLISPSITNINISVKCILI